MKIFRKVSAVDQDDNFVQNLGSGENFQKTMTFSGYDSNWPKWQFEQNLGSSEKIGKTEIFCHGLDVSVVDQNDNK